MSALLQSDVEFNQFSDFYKGWTWLTEDEAGVRTPVDLSVGFTAKAQVRRTKESVTALIEVTSVDAGGTVIDLDDEGNIDMFVSHTVTADIDWSKAVFDLVVTGPDGRKTRVIEGRATCDLGVTQ